MVNEAAGPDGASDLGPQLPEGFGAGREDARSRTARRVFQGALLFTCRDHCPLAVAARGGARACAVFGHRIDRQAIAPVVVGFLVFSVLWGWIWYGIRALLLRRFVGLSEGGGPRGLHLADASRRSTSPGTWPGTRAADPHHGHDRPARTLRDHRRDGLPLHLLAGGRGPEARVPGVRRVGEPVRRDGLQLADPRRLLFRRVLRAGGVRRADPHHGRHARPRELPAHHDALERFQVRHLPISARLALHFPPETFAPLFAFIWPSYLAADAPAEIVGSLFGKQKLRVWGIGDVNRKSVEGTVAGFLALARRVPGHRLGPAPAACRGSPGRRHLRSRTRCWSCSRRAAPTTSRWRPRTRCCAGGSARSSTEPPPEDTRASPLSDKADTRSRNSLISPTRGDGTAHALYPDRTLNRGVP